MAGLFQTERDFNWQRLTTGVANVPGLADQREQPRPKAISANNGRYGRMMTNGNLSRNTLKSSKKTVPGLSV